MAADICKIVLVGRLTKDPELRHIPNGTAICELRVAYSTSRKDAGGNWTDKSNYINVVVWGRRGETVAQYLSKGRQVCVEGRLEYDEWEAKDGGGKRSKHQIVADTVQFLGGKSDGDGGSGGGETYREEYRPADSQSDFVPAANSDDDIPF